MKNIPLTVPLGMQDLYHERYQRITQGTDRLFLFAADQKIEHLNQDFCGPTITPAIASPPHLFSIASKARIGVFATQLGLIARYGRDYPLINYVVKLNSKTNLIKPAQQDPVSLAFYSIEDVVYFQKLSKLNIVGVGYTIYPGSEHEAEMLSEAAQIIYHAHQYGLLVILWCYPRGCSVASENDAEVIAGAAGIAVCLGADFVKVRVPAGDTSQESANKLKQATIAAGNTKLLCSGGQVRSEYNLLDDVYHQIHTGGAAGAAIGRNIFTKNEQDALKLCAALAAIIYDDSEIAQAAKLL